ncbi:hypothetical protein TCAL_13210 [Tigriopus californicus]|uniref:Uncharacterized protein n=1 Tax=Tigriopus californicus TaxID=6832 RepID=A0A553PIB5_TIGCA|nr:hypothetical protein TCAL_13210 [Tigriopus californicus]
MVVEHGAEDNLLGGATNTLEHEQDVKCPRTSDRMELFACPTPDFRGRYRCIDDRVLCNGFFDCPGHEDENPDQCLFYKTEEEGEADVFSWEVAAGPNGRDSFDFPCQRDLLPLVCSDTPVTKYGTLRFNPLSFLVLSRRKPTSTSSLKLYSDGHEADKNEASGHPASQLKNQNKSPRILVTSNMKTAPNEALEL